MVILSRRCKSRRGPRNLTTSENLLCLRLQYLLPHLHAPLQEVEVFEEDVGLLLLAPRQAPPLVVV